MTAPMAQGRIVWVEICDPQGRNPKVRPAVVLTATNEIRTDGEIVVVAVTSRTGEAPPDVSVELPWLRGGHPRTKLDRPSAAVCSWLEVVPVAAVVRVGGIVPFDRMARIIHLVNFQDAETDETTPPKS